MYTINVPLIQMTLIDHSWQT